MTAEPDVIDQEWRDVDREMAARCGQHRGCYTDNHLSVADLCWDVVANCAPACDCWRHSVIRESDRRLVW